eukprot:COSAG01_NODE_8051_length_2940_cov_1.546287_4_plen_24_part_01
MASLLLIVIKAGSLGRNMASNAPL